MSAGWQWRLSPGAERDIKRLDLAIRRRVFDALDRLATNPEGCDVKKLMGRSNHYRLRDGDWRITYLRDTTAREYIVLAVEPRGRAYR